MMLMQRDVCAQKVEQEGIFVVVVIVLFVSLYNQKQFRDLAARLYKIKCLHPSDQIRVFFLFLLNGY